MGRCFDGTARIDLDCPKHGTVDADVLGDARDPNDADRRLVTDGGEPSRDELLDAIEEANDALAKALDAANIYVSHDETRPSALRACDRAQDAHVRLCDVDPTRESLENDEVRADGGRPTQAHSITGSDTIGLNCCDYPRPDGEGGCGNCGWSA